MQILRTIPALRRWREKATQPVVLVPTMGALHAGHAALIKRARTLAGKKGHVVVSIFVNPTQFGPKEDLSRYPRPFAADSALCKSLGVDAIFHPTPEAMYAEDASTAVVENSVSSGLCGASRPGHFRGVSTVVLKLFLQAQPHIAVFGRKDFQQCAVIARMVRDLDVPVRLVFAPTVREKDGLALSSRNVYLTPTERIQAPVLQLALRSAKVAYERGENSATKLHNIVAKCIAQFPDPRVDYIEVVDTESLEPVQKINAPTTIALAVFFGQTRLIDNIQLS